MDTMPLVETQIVEAPTSRLDRMEHKEAGQRHDVQRIVDIQRIEHPTPIERERREEVRPEVVVRNELPTAKDLSQAPVVASIESVVTSAAPEERVVETRASSILDRGIASFAGARSTARQIEAAQASPGSALASQSANQETVPSAPESERSGEGHSEDPPSSELADRVGSESPPSQASNVVASLGSPPSGESKRLDYGWLAHTIRARIEEVKRYSVEARVNEWEGQVVLSASILADGRIVDIRVVESSGNRRLDEDAKTMMGHASPLTLSQPIGLAKVTVKVPIIFGLQ
jgi:TonB family protein